ncbi:MAG: histidinol dehydrogenase [Candidatus Sumerlaeia bacterium]|nr:histidinol dehydrogenase [Candidatus Sumerlaeia bacterium]
MKTIVTILVFPRDRVQIEARLRSAETLEARRLRAVEAIIERVRREGDRALLELTRQFDGVRLSASQLRVPPAELEAAWRALPPADRRVLQLAKRRIEAFHRRQRRNSWTLRDTLGSRLTQRYQPLECVGIYVPGFLAALPSTVLMNAIPARVAGVARLVMATPPARSVGAACAIFAAAHLCGIREVYQVGGAQAIAALAFGTATIPRVDKVVGPGNIYVTLAKRLLYGRIDIDSMAGPSEILVLADSSARPAFVAADMISQAEHGPDSAALCIHCADAAFSQQIVSALEEQTAAAPRSGHIRKSLAAHGAIIQTETLEQAVGLANARAPEHLAVMTRRPRAVAKRLRNAGSIFVGPWTPEAIGDYTAGTNHTLPTGGTARFFSPLSVDDFLRFCNVVELTRRGVECLGPPTIRFAEMEGLHGHAQAVRERLKEL